MPKNLMSSTCKIRNKNWNMKSDNLDKTDRKANQLEKTIAMWSSAKQNAQEIVDHMANGLSAVLKTQKNYDLNDRFKATNRLIMHNSAENIQFEPNSVKNVEVFATFEPCNGPHGRRRCYKRLNRLLVHTKRKLTTERQSRLPTKTRIFAKAKINAAIAVHRTRIVVAILPTEFVSHDVRRGNRRLSLRRSADRIDRSIKCSEIMRLGDRRRTLFAMRNILTDGHN
uniref:Uncharacterized protein n=1 Tax=Romanomermis culicivorax TaxID=13658 RepID=A0A915J7N1_ROMCU